MDATGEIVEDHLSALKVVVEQELLDRLLDLENPTPAEVEYWNLLGDLVIVWEQGRYELPSVSPIERLRIGRKGKLLGKCGGP